MSGVSVKPSDCEQRGVIRYLYLLGVPTREIHRRLCTTYGENNVYKIRSVYYWVEQFTKGRTDLHDNERSGRPSEAVNFETVNIVRTLLAKDRRYTISDLHHKIATDYPYVTCSRTSIFTILTQELEMRKISARWVPRQLLPKHLDARFLSALEFLRLYKNSGNTFLDQIVTGDETWVHYWTPETKQASMQWQKKGEKTPRKFKTRPSAGKIMMNVFWDNKGILLLEYFPKTQNVNQETYFDSLMKLRQAIKIKRPGKLSKKIVLLHDNARPHVAALVTSLLKDFDWTVFSHPPYSPDLAPSDFHLFPSLKKWLGGRHFDSDVQLQATVDEFFSKQDASWYAHGIEKLVSRYNKCLDLLGDYVEK